MDSAEVYTLRAKSHFLQGSFSAAVIEGRNALSKTPNHHPALALMGNIFLETGDPKLAIQYIQRPLS